MNRKAVLCLLVLLVAISLIPQINAAIICTINASSSCDSGTKYLGLENDTSGYTNAHAQTHSTGTYANSLCCTTNITDTIGYDCADETLLRLSDTDNAHAQNNTIGTYSTDVCLSFTNTNITCSYVNGSCGSGTCVLSMSAHDNAHLGACGDYDINLCCVVDNTPPTVPVLLLPIDGNTSVFERHSEFDWNDSTDAESDPITYEIAIDAPAGCGAIPNRNVSPSQYASIEELCVDESYNWTVRACDDKEACSAWATEWNFTIGSVIGISFSLNTTDFGALSPSVPGSIVVEDTLDSDPSPLVLVNNGNVDVNVDAKALGSLWTNAGLNESNFQFADENSSSWTDMSDAYFAFTDGLEWDDEREMEVRVEVPLSEPPGSKSSIVQALAESAEGG